MEGCSLISKRPNATLRFCFLRRVLGDETTGTPCCLRQGLSAFMQDFSLKVLAGEGGGVVMVLNDGFLVEESE